MKSNESLLLQGGCLEMEIKYKGLFVCKDDIVEPLMGIGIGWIIELVKT